MALWGTLEDEKDFAGMSAYVLDKLERYEELGEDEVGEAFDLAIGLFWYCVHYHGGMWSPEYSVQCILTSTHKLRAADSTEPPDGMTEPREDTYGSDDVYLDLCKLQATEPSPGK